MNEDHMSDDELIYATLLALTQQNVAEGDNWRYQYVIGPYVLLFDGQINDSEGIYGVVSE